MGPFGRSLRAGTAFRRLPGLLQGHFADGVGDDSAEETKEKGPRHAAHARMQDDHPHFSAGLDPRDHRYRKPDKATE